MIINAVEFSAAESCAVTVQLNLYHPLPTNCRLELNNVLNPVYTPSLADNGQQITFTLTVTYPGTVPSP